MGTETTNASKVVKGLKGVQAADSTICLVDGERGKLLYRGYDIEGLAKHCRFEEVVGLLLQGELPNAGQLESIRADMTEQRPLHPLMLKGIQDTPPTVHPMAVLRSCFAFSGLLDPTAEDDSSEANYRKLLRMTSQLTSMVAAIHRIRQGKPAVAPRADLSHAANFMYMLNDREPTADETRAMDLVLTLHAEHGLNASTFAARVIIATLTDVYSALCGAVGALKGKLHGGANTEVLKSLQEIGSVENVAGWVENVRARKGKFMGFGHAVYQTVDPRARFLKELSQRLGQEQGDSRWYEISAELERQVKAAIDKNCNVDFYSASLQHYLGIPGELFTCIFAASRIVGWGAHILEQLSDNKIIRPMANYVGPAERPFVPLEQR